MTPDEFAEVECTYEIDQGSGPGWTFLGYTPSGMPIEGAVLLCDVHNQAAGHPVYDTADVYPYRHVGPCQWHEYDFIDAWGEEWKKQTYTLPEQRILTMVRSGGRGAVHVVQHLTFPASTHPGRWTRRAAQRRALCGGLRAMSIGADAENWPTEVIEPDDLHRVTCARCKKSAARLFNQEMI